MAWLMRLAGLRVTFDVTRSGGSEAPAPFSCMDDELRLLHMLMRLVASFRITRVVLNMNSILYPCSRATEAFASHPNGKQIYHSSRISLPSSECASWFGATNQDRGLK